MKQIKFLLAFLMVVCVFVGGLTSCDFINSNLIPDHQHTLQRVDAKQATCTTPGTEAYYTCTDCNKLYADAEGKTVINAPVVVPALGHDIVKDEAKAPTCVVTGLSEGEHCKRCDYSISRKVVPATNKHMDNNSDERCDTCGTYMIVKTVFEAEHAQIHGAPTHVEFNSACSNGQNVGYFNATGQVLVFIIYSDKAEENVPFLISAATGDAGYSEKTMSSMIACNGVALRNASGSIPGGSWTNYASVTGLIDLIEGKNVITIAYGGTATNIDYIDIASKAATLTWDPIIRTDPGQVDAFLCTDEDNNRACDGCGAYVAPTNDDWTEIEGGLTKDEFYAQVAYYGDNENETRNSSMRIGFSVKMKQGTVVKFFGDSSTYSFAVLEKDGDYSFFSGWLDDSEYTLSRDSYPTLMLSRKDGAAISTEELVHIHTFFTVTGEKLAYSVESDLLSSEEFNSQVVHYGSVPNPTNNTRARISFAIKLQKGTTIRFIGDSNVYKWAVVEMYHTANKSGYLDLGWNTSWANPKANYTTYMDGVYIAITVSKMNNSALTAEDLSNIHTMFEVVGLKWTAPTVSHPITGVLNFINHRGYCVKAPENTLSAYRESALNGFSMVECDVLFTADGVPVLLHDGSIDRTSNGMGQISSLTLEEVRQYDFGSWKSPVYAGEKIPTFDEFMALCAELDLHPYIEIKGTITADQAKTLIAIVAKYGRQDQVSWISFDLPALQRIKELDDDARLGYVVNSVNEGIVATSKSLQNGKNEVFIDCNYTAVNETVASLCRTGGIALEVWTLNSPIDFEKLNPYVSGVSSDWMLVPADTSNH